MRPAKSIHGIAAVFLCTAGILAATNVSALDNPEKVIEETCARDWAHN